MNHSFMSLEIDLALEDLARTDAYRDMSENTSFSLLENQTCTELLLNNKTTMTIEHYKHLVEFSRRRVHFGNKSKNNLELYINTYNKCINESENSIKKIKKR